MALAIQQNDVRYNSPETPTIVDGIGVYLGLLLTYVSYVQSFATNELATKQTLQVYPNPANEMLTVVLSGNGKQTIELMDVYGQSIWSSTSTLPVVQIPLGNVPNGWYSVRAGSTVSKVLVVK